MARLGLSPSVGIFFGLSFGGHAPERPLDPFSLPGRCLGFSGLGSDCDDELSFDSATSTSALAGTPSPSAFVGSAAYPLAWYHLVPDGHVAGGCASSAVDEHAYG